MNNKGEKIKDIHSFEFKRMNLEDFKFQLDVEVLDQKMNLLVYEVVQIYLATF